MRKKQTIIKKTAKKVTKKANLPQVVENKTPMSTFHSADLLISQLAGKDVDVEKMEKLLALKGKYEAEENKKLFQIKFCKLQYELPVIKKTKSVDNKYKYAPLEEIVKQIKPFLREHGFSYRWSEGISENKECKRIICHIMSNGHEETSYVDIPMIMSPVTRDGKKIINDAQVAGSMSTYGKRYSLIGALGIMADEDDDGRGVGKVKDITPPKDENPKISKAKAIASVQKKYKELCKYSNPNDALKEFLAQIELKELQEIIGMSQKLDQLMSNPRKKS